MQVEIGNLPIWRGVQDRPGFTALPFTFDVSAGLIRLSLTASELDQIVEEYSRDSYSFITSPPGSSEWGTRQGDLYFRMLAQQVGDLAGKTVLEIGSGTLYIAERVVGELQAFHLVACDPALRAESRLRSVEVLREYFNEDLLGSQAFDLVLSINNLEHVPNPQEYLAAIRRLLESSNGVLYLVTPDSSRGLQTGDLGICVHEHLSYFVPETFTALLAASGLTTEWLHVEEDTIFATARPASTHADPVDHSKISTDLLTQFATRSRHNLELARQLIFENRQGARLGIHGCSAGLNNLLALIGMQSDPNVFLFDMDSSKVGKYLPAFDRPILAASDDQYKTMQAMVVSALTFYSEIADFAVNNHGLDRDRVYPITPLEDQAPL